MSNLRSETNSKTKVESGVKSSKDSPRIALKDLQQNREELDRCKKSPIYFYNTYVRKEGQPILSEEEYKEKMKIEFNKRRSQYPLTPSEAFRLIDDDIPPALIIEVADTKLLEELENFNSNQKK